MSEGHSVEQLKSQHAALENALQAEEIKPQPDQLAVAGIKKKKLRIKDQIARLEHA